MTNVQAIVAEMLKGNQTADEIANNVVAIKPDATFAGIRNQIKGIIRLVKDNTKDKWKRYTLSEDGISLINNITDEVVSPIQIEHKERKRRVTEKEEKYGSKHSIKAKCNKCGRVMEITTNNKGIYNEEYYKNYICILCK